MSWQKGESSDQPRARRYFRCTFGLIRLDRMALLEDRRDSEYENVDADRWTENFSRPAIIRFPDELPLVCIHFFIPPAINGGRLGPGQRRFGHALRD
jgi:hypothetical protein